MAVCSICSRNSQESARRPLAIILVQLVLLKTVSKVEGQWRDVFAAARRWCFMNEMNAKTLLAIEFLRMFVCEMCHVRTGKVPFCADSDPCERYVTYYVILRR